MSVPEPSKVPVGTQFNVRISEFENPSRFWYQRKDYSQCLDRLEAEMQRFYEEDDESVIFEILNFKKPAAGQPIAFKCNSNWGNWYRGFIQGYSKPNILKVYYTDYGTTNEVRLQDVRYLAPQFQKLQAQGILARLSGVQHLFADWPVEGIRYAKDEAIKAYSRGDFLVTVEGYHITTQGCFASVIVKTDKETILSEELVKRRFALAERPAFVEDNFKLDCSEKISCIHVDRRKKTSRIPSLLTNIQSILEARLRIKMQNKLVKNQG